PYEAYGRLSELLSTPTLMAGREHFQKEAESLIADDVLLKLRPGQLDRLLEIGCGVGVILRPLSEHVAEAVGLDHPSCLRKFSELGIPANVELVPGQWPEAKPEGSFDRILVYSVLQYLSGPEEARLFIKECLRILRPGGTLMLGDVPNVDSKRRFLNSSFGRKFSEEYAKRNSRAGEASEEQMMRDELFSAVKAGPPYLTDQFILGLLAVAGERGMESYAVPQPADLPFSYTREDILIRRRS
ncbi:MAG TPA: class I SAM-dependent methyltransferase, partial [Blastocatellia bacterium]|nr:class I SAM-dependent methyltransferase [Blastocatellia bacterium]